MGVPGRSQAGVAALPVRIALGGVGAAAESLQRSCLGQGAHELGRERPAFQEYDPSGSALGTISNERTFREDVRDRLASSPCCVRFASACAGELASAA